jgi:hypothetical protein
MNLTKVIYFSLNKTILKSSSISNGMMTLTVDFFDNILGKEAEIMLEYDPEYVKSPHFNAKILMVESTGLELTVE